MPNPLAADLDEVLDRTQDVWRALDGASIFVTGGTGFYGRWLLESFAWAVRYADLKANLTVLSRSRSALAQRAPHLAEHSHIRFIRGDVRTFEFPDGPCSHVIHAATPASASEHVDEKELTSVIEDGTDRTVLYAITTGAQRFLLASSGAVYGRQPPDLERMGEDRPPTQPWTVYGRSKREAEDSVLEAAGLRKDFQPVVARGFAFVGPHLPGGFAVSDFLEAGLTEGVVRVAGDGTPVRSYLYAADLAEWLWRLLAFGQAGRVYNVGSHRPISIRDLAGFVQTATGASEVTFGAEPEDAVAPERYVPDVSRIQKELGVRQTVSLEEALFRTVAWMRGR